jgi:hypothetical protein
MVTGPRFSLISRSPLCRCFAIALFSISTSIFSGPLQPRADDSVRGFMNPVFAQTPITSEEITRYARSILDIEPIRQTAYEQIQQQNGSVPLIDCYNPDRLNALSPRIRVVAINYCQQSQGIVQSNGLSLERFNEITQVQERNSQVRETIRNEMIRIQKQRAQG